MLLCIVLDRGAAGPLMDTMGFRVTKHTLSWRRVDIMSIMCVGSMYSKNTQIRKYNRVNIVLRTNTNKTQIQWASE